MAQSIVKKIARYILHDVVSSEDLHDDYVVMSCVFDRSMFPVYKDSKHLALCKSILPELINSYFSAGGQFSAIQTLCESSWSSGNDDSLKRSILLTIIRNIHDSQDLLRLDWLIDEMLVFEMHTELFLYFVAPNLNKANTPVTKYWMSYIIDLIDAAYWVEIQSALASWRE